MRICIYTNIHKHIHTYIHRSNYTHIHAYTLEYIHTHTKVFIDNGEACAIGAPKWDLLQTTKKIRTNLLLYLLFYICIYVGGKRNFVLTNVNNECQKRNQMKLNE